MISFTIADPLKETILNGIVTQLQGVTDDVGTPVFQQVLRGMPTTQTIQSGKKPSAYVSCLNERPDRSQILEVVISRLPVVVLVVGQETSQQNIDSEANKLDALVRKKLERNTLGGAISAECLEWIGTDTPLANQSLPIGTIAPMFQVQYIYQRIDPWLS